MLYLVSIEGFLFFSSLFFFLIFFCWSLFKLVLKVSEASRTDSGCIGLRMTLKDSLLHSVAEKKKHKQNTGIQGTMFWEKGFKMQLINFF